MRVILREQILERDIFVYGFHDSIKRHDDLVQSKVIIISIIHCNLILLLRKTEYLHQIGQFKVYANFVGEST